MKEFLVIGEKYCFSRLDKKKLLSQKIKIREVNEMLFLAHPKKFLSFTQNIILNSRNSHLEKFLKNEKLNYLTIEDFLELFLKKTYIPRWKSSTEVFHLDIKPFSKTSYIIKRIIDFGIAIPLGILTSPIMLYSIYRIKKESPDGPIIFKQKRVGKDGKEFVCYKFRSMIPDAEKGKPQFASKDDPRVFKWGAFMRKTRIDELPQLWNVIKGDMHIIGPRPERKYWVDIFEKEIPFYNYRHLIKPGITGWAQVCYPYGSNIEDAYQKLTYDLYYIKNWNLWIEIKTIFKTILVMVGKRGL
jgi:lipopolysaccharide/colanic/teichoic acid biosynthesis glycosyltransferase